MRYNELWRAIAGIYGEHEAKAMVRTLLNDFFGFTLTDIVCGAVDSLSEADANRLYTAVGRLAEGEPVQYVSGTAMFCDRKFCVKPGVLIPRPETEQLCHTAIQKSEPLPHPRILDIGTGSGCIACTVALALPQATVEAWDVSSEALAIAAENADRLGAGVTFRNQDALAATQNDGRRWDVIVSNPPYICNKEKCDMEANVLDHEPSLALFVPDDDPLLFYRAIAGYAMASLERGGSLCFEINSLYARETEEMLRGIGFADVETMTDIFGKERNTICRKL